MVRICRRYLTVIAFSCLIIACQQLPTERGQQYKDGKLAQTFVTVVAPNTSYVLANAKDYRVQLEHVQIYSPNLYLSNQSNYQAIERWLASGAKLTRLTNMGLQIKQLQGADHYGNVRFTGYYTPVLSARLQPDTRFKYPLYAMPPKKKFKRLPHRAAIHAGELVNLGLELAYTESLVDNFMMGVQGSGYIDFGNNEPLNFFAYGGKNGYPYKSIGKVLIERGEIPASEMSMQAIKKWATKNSEETVLELLAENPSFVFFTPQGDVPVKGASSVPLIAQASVAADRTLIPPGTTLLMEIPQLDTNGKFNGRYALHLVIALDVGGAIKGHHFDVYQGIGQLAGERAGLYNHFGRVWVLTTDGERFID